ncbi:MAG: YfhO family protein [Clostridium sp.]|nr:YfhO family protein [Clostridium sp.]
MNQLISRLKDRRVWGTLLAVVIIAVISMAYFHPDAVEGNVLQQHDMQQGTAIGQEAKLFHDQTGETTRWTNSLFSGMPTFQISPSYPSNALFAWINTVMGLGLPAPANILAMMIIGFLILLLTMRMRLPVALIGAVAYGFSTYYIIIIGAGHLWKFITLAYVAPTIAGLILCYRGRWLAGGAMTALFGMMQIASNHVQMTYYFLFVVAGLMIAFLVRDIRRRQVGRWCVATGVLVVAGGLAVTANLPSLYNTYEYSKETIRGNHSDLSSAAGTSGEGAGLDKAYITQYSYTIPETWTLLIPNVKGGATMKPEKGSGRYMSLYAMEETRELVNNGKLDPQAAYYLQYVPQYFGAPEGTNGPVYVGALIFALFLLGCFIVRGPVKWALLLLTLFSIVLSWGRYFMGPTDFMIDYFPMYSRFRTVESILVIAGFTMPLLGAMALQKIFTAPEPLRAFGPRIWGTFGFTLFVCLLGIITPSVFGSVVPDHEIESGLGQLYAYAPFRAAVEQLRSSLVSADSLRSFIVVAAGLIVIVAYSRWRLNATMALTLVGLVIVGDLFLVNKRYLDHDSFTRRPSFPAQAFPLTDADRAILSDTTSSYRVMDIPRFWEAAPSYYHKTIGGYHAAKLTRYQDLIDRHLSHFTDGQGVDSVDMEVLSMLNARYIILDSAYMRNPDARGNAWLVDRVEYVATPDAEMDALSEINLRTTAVADRRFEQALGASAPRSEGDTIFLTSYAPNRLTYSATSARGGVALFSEIYFPWGWSATVDGEPAEIGRANWTLRALRLPAGHHTVVMTFDPESLHTTGTAATIAIILIYAAVALSLFFWIRRPATLPAKSGETPAEA